MVSNKKTRMVSRKSSNSSEKMAPEKNSNFFSRLFLIAFSILFGFLNYAHIIHLQEHNLMFSHLSTLERELSFRTEMGFYYSFYKQIIESSSIYRSIDMLVRDNLTEYPDTINSLQRFNIYPEFALGIFYKLFQAIFQGFGIETSTCYTVNRGDLPPVRSCDGMGEPAVFYVTVVMIINGVMMSCLFAVGYLVAGGSLIGGVVTTVLFLFNHRECTRVQWTPPLRESFSYPILVMQQLILLHILCQSSAIRISITSKVAFVLTTLMSLLSWQFAQFALLTQCVAIFLAYIIAGDNVKRDIVRNIYVLLIIADVANLVFQFGNTLLLIAPLRPCLIMGFVIITYENSYISKRFQNSIWMPLRWVFLLLLLFISTALLKYFTGVVLQIKSDDHMFDILRSKFSNFTSFDSLLYTCAPEFDFYEMSSITQISLTGLLPLAASSLIIILCYTTYKWLQCFWRKSPLTSSNEITASGFCEIHEFYLFFQSIAYMVMAGLIMRLKLFATPQLCIMAALIFNPKWPLFRLSDYVTQKFINSSNQSTLNIVYKKIKLWPVILILAMCSVKGYRNLKSEWEIQGIYANWEQEQLMNFINSNTHPSDSFTGQMATMATVRLVTGRPIVIHPHYENEQLRKRVHIAYSVYSKKSLREVWFLLRTKLQAKYLVYEHAHCQLRPHKPGCSYLEMWDIEDPGNSKNFPACGFFEEYVTNIHKNSPQQSGSSLSIYFKWKYTTDNMGYSLFEITDVP